MDRHVRLRFCVELGLGVASGLLLVVTLTTREWIELVFRVDPDNGSGALEWVIVTCLVLLTLFFTALARREHRRPRPTGATASDKRI
ncbi:MAG TPA: hypothetical protein VEK86_12050 [Gemmatimonadales bacterium]|nr:hypothetical protein [Gemmatimonadales bacterium]